MSVRFNPSRSALKPRLELLQQVFRQRVFVGGGGRLAVFDEVRGDLFQKGGGAALLDAVQAAAFLTTADVELFPRAGDGDVE